MKKVNVLVVGAELGGNLGAEAMLVNIVKKIERMPINASFTFEVCSESKRSVYRKKFKDSQHDVVLFSPKNMFFPYSKPLGNIDLVIDIGGLAYADTGVRDNLRNFVRHYYLYRTVGKMIFFTQDFGPARSLSTKLFGRYILRRSSAIFSRSEVSKKRLLEDFKLNSDLVRGPFPDSTLVLDPESGVKEFPAQYVIVSPSAILYNKFGELYIEFLKRIITKLKERFDVHILVHCFTENKGSSDQKVASQLADETGLQCVDGEMSVGQIKKFFEGASLAVTSRYHVLVGCFSVGTPCLAIGWNSKYSEFLKLYGKEHFLLGTDLSNLDSDLVRLEQLMDSYAEEGKDISIKSSSLKVSVESSFSLLEKDILDCIS